ncbi:Winged helix-turn-helix transcription repressor DNA-binding [Penicillium odoratum]|uniref:Winged helix-turn-helix transcription repressor DNA-binding n=1 Tax=Penicillium odoratum TaxID=1167516 RepID=UPI0025482B0E|nr:Winged helix-turn-helix transcription repressor DNA-binding [Penicillium odoratum]KAJ5777473.1 Winged helix-turn-helix transcription repressor DNA-binding [Penicillium odoratum]
MPTFSYAQAAKGVSETPAPAKPVSKEPEMTESKPEEKSIDIPAEPVAISATETSQETEKATPSVDEDAEFTTVTNKHASRPKAAHSRTSSPSVRSTATQSKEGESSNTSNGTQEASEKQADKAENDTEESKDKSAKSAKSEKAEKSDKSEKAEKSTPPKELKAAPLPSVNIWLQRKEAQEAKAKTSPAPVTGKPTSGKAAEENQHDSPKTNSKKKGSDGSQEGAKGSKKADGAKGRDGALPPVEDAVSWPTPQVAIVEDKKKAQEKTDKTEKSEKSPVSRTHGKEKWMPVNYTPTAVFNTPLPSAGRGGRRPTRGGRDGGRGGAHAGAAEKAASGQSGPGSAGKQASGERGRNEAGTNRAASLPAQARRSTSSEVAIPEGRKTQAVERNNRPARGAEDAAASNGKQANGGENARPQRDGKQFNRNNETRAAKGGQPAVDSQAAGRANERRVESGSKSADVGPNGFQDFNRGAERGGRSSRGRGGAYSGFGGQNGQFGSVGHNFAPKNFGFNDRQRSQHGLANGSQQGNRMPLRSPSLGGSANQYGVYPFPSEINAMYPYQAVNPGPMSAVPYQSYMEPFGLMSMLSIQLEYYFSVDNMCKDMFLRSQMDSQGFVPLSVIANFKRVKTMTEDFELLRHISRQLRTVEYQTGEDGVDRLRPRENWTQWVLPGAAPAQPKKNDENTPVNNQVGGASNGLHPGSQQFVPNGTSSHNSRTALSSNAPEFLPSAQNEIATVRTPQDFFYYPASGFELDSSFDIAAHLEITCIDEYRPARGLNSLTTTPPFSPQGAAEQLAGKFHGQYKRHPSTKYPARPTPMPSHLSSDRKRKGPPKKKHAEVDESLEVSEKFESGGEPQPLDLSLISPTGYRYWLGRLKENFQLKMYNEFRRQALDDVFTRHTYDGFDSLMEFYRFTLGTKSPLRPQILSDMVGLCRDERFKPQDVMFSVVRTALAKRDPDSEKTSIVANLFNHEFGDTWSRPVRKPYRHRI